MANKEVTELRVGNVLKQIPREITQKREGKLRSTMNSTLSSMKTVLSQLKKGNMDKLRQEKRRRKVITITILSIVAVAVVIITIMLFRR